MGENLSGNLELRKTHGSNYFWGYLENKTLNLYGPIFQKDPPPPGKSLFDNFCLNMGDSCYSVRSTVVIVVLVLVVVAVVVVVVA